MCPDAHGSPGTRVGLIAMSRGLAKAAGVGGDHGILEHDLPAEKALDEERPESGLRDSLGEIQNQKLSGFLSFLRTYGH